uniref:Uncharacterized protein n=1 Tax=Panagrolaimus sp. JU765 TaxID=591449 RepID=A0AC34QJ95_9BILA
MDSEEDQMLRFPNMDVLQQFLRAMNSAVKITIWHIGNLKEINGIPKEFEDFTEQTMRPYVAKVKEALEKPMDNEKHFCCFAHQPQQ